MRIELKDLNDVQDLSADQLGNVRGGLYWNFYRQPSYFYNSFYRPILPLNTFAGALNNGWALQGAAFDRGFNSWMTNFRNS